MKGPSAGERFRYWFDGVMSRGIVALISLLALASLAFIAVVSIVVVILGFFPPEGDLGFGETLWASLMRTLDPGTMGGDEGPQYRAAMLIVTLGGLILVASLIGIISNAFDARVDELRKGRSRVLETDHTLILGWSTKVFSAQPSLVGKTYFDTQLAFATSCVMGIATADGEVLLNPPADTPYRAGDQLILIAEDDSTIQLAPPGTPDPAVVTALAPTAVSPERALILGFNSALPAILTELDQYVAPGSSVTLIADVSQPQLPVCKNLRVDFTRADTTSRATLEGLAVQDFQHIMVLAYSDDLEPQRADARTLITLLHLRDIAERAGQHLHVVSEMLDDKNRVLAEITEADDFIVSNKLTSLMLSQISENAALSDVFESLFSSEGSEVYLRPAEEFIATGIPVDFYSVREAARQRGETAIGYRVAEHAHSNAHAYGVTVNPDKTLRRNYAPGDRVIVLAED